ncbi:hypothetical protein [Alicycliphilus denitrificans]|uniref:hypothetical protein n=1 Tax=Alicycliphilus denitrificans TaxID=179636 RepID=UPI0001DA054C|nr:hypothetical protein [Alicycliphilus denitrificans]ADU99400.1 hypothetical protein Alide_1644 [Alicycliphilus denitrificans BC]
MSIDYIRKTYGLTVKVGDQVSIRKGAGTWFDGLHGKLLRAQGQYLVVAGETWRGNFHPADVEPIQKDTP